MRCSRCYSENVQANVVTKKNPIVAGMVMALGGIGLMLLGIFGALIGFFIGLIIGLVIKACMGELRETIFVCRNCGNTFSIKQK